MIQGWRFQIRQAEQALQDGRLDEAADLLRHGDLATYLPGKQLAAKLAGQLAERARQRIAAGESSAGWQDLETARALAHDAGELLRAQQAIVHRLAAEIEDLLTAGEMPRAIRQLESLEKRAIGVELWRRLKEIAQRLESAKNLSARGKFVEAETHLAAAAGLRPDLAAIGQLRSACRENIKKSQEFTEKLHAAMTARDWNTALVWADRLLEIAPESALARDARQRAWQDLPGRGAASDRRVQTVLWQPATRFAGDSSLPADDGPRGRRFLLWVDGVGGFLVCMGDEILLGQAAPGNKIDVALQADLSRRHARIRRSDGSYVIEPIKSVRVAGREIQSPFTLRDGDEIELGTQVRLRFRQPHALSATARLEPLSRHRFEPPADAVLLMAESCVLGPKVQDHVVCRDWSSDVVLFRHDGQLCCRAVKSLEIDGEFCDGRGGLNPDSHVAGSDFSFSLEPIGS